MPQLSSCGVRYATCLVNDHKGLGIDYSVHMTQRFREELGKVGDRFQALHQTAQGTGAALTGSAASSIAGFAVMGFAPMPLFSAYGILTATMIFLAFAAALLVLPSVLLMVTPQSSEWRCPFRWRLGW